MRNSVLLIALIGLCCMGCGHKKAGAEREHPEDAAVAYIQNMADEKYDECIKYMISCDSASDAYKAKMKVLLKQFVRRKKENGAGLKNVECIHTDISTNGCSADTYMRLTYTNDSVETMVLPLVWQGKSWRLR